VNFWRFSRVVTVVGCTLALVAGGACSSKGSDGDQDKKGAEAKKGKKGKKGRKKGKRAKAGKGAKPGDGNQMVIPPAPPPAVVAKPPVAAPELPELAAQAKPDAGKGGGDSKCGDAAMGDGAVALDCAGGDEALPHPLVPLVTYASMHADEATLPAVVDHRADGTEGAVRNQGKAPLSSAFALAAAVDHALAQWLGAPGKTSVMHVWSRYHTANLSKALKGSADAGLADEETWPYAGGDAVSWFEACEKWAGTAKCGKPVDAEKLKAADAKVAATALDTEDLGTAVEAPVLRAKLAAGQDVLVSIKLGASFKPVGKEGAMYVPNYEGGKGVHTVLLAGYATYPHGTYFLVHNSAGEKWGDKGYAWIHEATLKTNLAHAFVVDARPTDASKFKTKAHKPATGPCRAGQVPDSVSGACAPVCPDHSPRRENVCPKKDDCPKGLVNLTGTCVLAAPEQRSQEQNPKEFRYVCGPGGCFYRIPKGKAGCDKEACPASCPAPAFRAMTGGRDGVTCWE
jgi:Papain family cysteine protease